MPEQQRLGWRQQVSLKGQHLSELQVLHFIYGKYPNLDCEDNQWQGQ